MTSGFLVQGNKDAGFGIIDPWKDLEAKPILYPQGQGQDAYRATDAARGRPRRRRILHHWDERTDTQREIRTRRAGEPLWSWEGADSEQLGQGCRIREISAKDGRISLQRHRSHQHQGFTQLHQCACSVAGKAAQPGHHGLTPEQKHHGCRQSQEDHLPAQEQPGESQD